jgi:hypothetical protein
LLYIGGGIAFLGKDNDKFLAAALIKMGGDLDIK